jgi:UDP:flavonoid glycosyltransferase YjiC (YdhE family)
MPGCAAVVCHAGHGTVARALASGTPILGCPAAGDMAENGARLQWSGAGMSLPNRLLSARTLRWTVQTVLERESFARRAGELGAWAAANDGVLRAAKLVERLAAGRGDADERAFENAPTSASDSRYD